MFVARIDELADADIAVLDVVLAAAKRKRDEADLEIAAVAAVVDSRQLFQEHSQSSIKAYLKQQLNCSVLMRCGSSGGHGCSISILKSLRCSATVVLRLARLM